MEEQHLDQRHLQKVDRAFVGILVKQQSIVAELPRGVSCFRTVDIGLLPAGVIAMV